MLLAVDEQGNTKMSSFNDATKKAVEDAIERMRKKIESNLFIDLPRNYIVDMPDEKNCECGKEKHGFTSHCDWCPLYKEKEE